MSAEVPSDAVPTRWALLFVALALLIGAAAVLFVGGDLLAASQ